MFYLLSFSLVQFRYVFSWINSLRPVKMLDRRDWMLWFNYYVVAGCSSGPCCFSPASEHPLSDSVPGCHKKRFAKQDYPKSQGTEAPKKRATNLSTADKKKGRREPNIMPELPPSDGRKRHRKPTNQPTSQHDLQAAQKTPAPIETTFGVFRSALQSKTSKTSALLCKTFAHDAEQGAIPTTCLNSRGHKMAIRSKQIGCWIRGGKHIGRYRRWTIATSGTYESHHIEKLRVRCCAPSVWKFSSTVRRALVG